MRHDSAKRHMFGGCAPQRAGVYDPQIQTRPSFLCNAPTPKFHHPTLSRSEVTVLTNTSRNPQTDFVETANALRYAMTLGNKKFHTSQDDPQSSAINIAWPTSQTPADTLEDHGYGG